jgi:hypothetical protein
VTPTQRPGQSGRVMRVKRLRAEDVSLVAAIDRSEHIDVQYRVVDSQLQQVPAATTEVPTWDPTGSGPHSVAAEIEFCRSAVTRGGVLLGAFEAERTAGLAIVHPSFEPLLASWARPICRSALADMTGDRAFSVRLGEFRSVVV